MVHPNAALLLLALAAAAAAPSPPAAPPPAAPPPAAAEAPFPPGMSSATLEGLRCSVVMPPEWDPAKERSLVVILHGNGGTETGMAGSLQFLAEREFVVVAPKSRGLGWDAKDVEAVRRITADLKKRLKVGPARLHAAGFSNGGWNLAPLAFDEALVFTSACWIAAGYKGGSVPKHAKNGMGVLALAGEEDGNRPHAEKTPDLLEGKVRSAMCRLQPGKGHEWPDALMPFYGWWLEVQEGRFEPGRCLPFDWVEDPAAGAAAAKERKTGALEYWWSAKSAGDAAARALQNETLLDPLVQRFGRQCAAWKRDAEAEGAAEAMAAAKVKEVPAVVVYDRKGEAVKVLQGRITPAALAQALRAVAPDKSLPK